MSSNDHAVVRYETKEMAEPVSGGVPQETLFQIVSHHRKMVVVMVVVCVAAAVTYLMLASRVYTSTARLHIVQDAPRLMGDRPILAQSQEVYLNSECQIISSTAILAEAIRKSQAGQMRTFEEAGEDPIVYLQKEVNVVPGKKNDLISISFASPYPEEADRIVDAIVEAYLAYHAKRSQSRSAEMLRILQQQRQSLDAAFDAKQNEMAAFQKAHGTLYFEGEKGNLVLGRLAELSAALVTARRARIEAEAAYEAAAGAVKDPDAMWRIIEAQQSRGVAALDREYVDLQAQLHTLRAQHTLLLQRLLPNHGSVIAVEEAMRHVQASIAEKQERFAKAYLLAQDQQRMAARKIEEEIAKEYETQEQAGLDLNAKAADLARLKSDLARMEKASDTLDGRIKELTVAESAGVLNIDVLEPAHIQKSLTEPRAGRTLGIGLVAGLALGVLAALVRDHRNQAFRSSSEIKAMLGTSALYLLPRMRSRAGRRARAVQLEPASEVAEAYRILRTVVCQKLKDSGGKTLLVTSPESGDGKSTVASNLAIALAQAGHRTLLLDADLRNPALQRGLHVAGEKGLADVLAGRALLGDAIYATEIEGLQIVPSGAVPSNPAEILHKQEFTNMLQTVKEHYDYIVLDSPPALTVADAYIVAPQCDASLLVLRAGKSNRNTSYEACQSLISVGARIVGVVVNDVVSRQDRYGYRARREGHGELARSTTVS